MIQFDDMKTTAPGVYMILNIVTNCRYVGSAAKRIANRFYEHRYSLKHNKHANPHLQNAWNKHGKDAFVFVALENTSRDEALDAEQRWYELFKGQGLPLYNIRENVKSQLGFKHSPETVAKFSAAHRGMKHSLSPEGLANIREAQRRRNQTRNEREPRNALSFAKEFTLISPTGETVTGRNLTEFTQLHGLNYTAIRKVVMGKRAGYMGWTRPESREEFFAKKPVVRGLRIPIVCGVCGKTFEVKPSHADKRRFCSQECRHKNDSQTFSGEGNPRYKHGQRVAGVKRVRVRHH